MERQGCLFRMRGDDPASNAADINNIFSAGGDEGFDKRFRPDRAEAWSEVQTGCERTSNTAKDRLAHGHTVADRLQPDFENTENPLPRGKNMKIIDF
jgi:hypothetical protein